MTARKAKAKAKAKANTGVSPLRFAPVEMTTVWLRGGKRGEVGLVDAGGGLAGFYFFEEPDEEDAGYAEEGEPAEDVDEGPVGGLLA